MEVTTCTIVYLFRGRSVCLGLKKRGFGEGYWNGFGGKVRAGESLRGAAVRELEEESLVRVDSTALDTAGVLTFTFRERPGWTLVAHLFRVVVFDGEPVETDEMRPQWFSIDKMPYNEMWADDQIWMPSFFVGEYIQARFSFADKNVVSYDFVSRAASSMAEQRPLKPKVLGSNPRQPIG
jgi:8-oxo-dGTP pyrophosphatase MutT (NUDIX family)